MIKLSHLFLDKMTKLYSNLSEIYEVMYQTFINYDEEYAYYNNKLRKYNSGSLFELGCGTGNLGSRFIAGSFDKFVTATQKNS